MNALTVEPELDSTIKELQKCDSEVEEIKRNLADGKHTSFTIADDGTLFFKNRLVVP